MCYSGHKGALLFIYRTKNPFIYKPSKWWCPPIRTVSLPLYPRYYNIQYIKIIQMRSPTLDPHMMNIDHLSNRMPTKCEYVSWFIFYIHFNSGLVVFLWLIVWILVCVLEKSKRVNFLGFHTCKGKNKSLIGPICCPSVC